MKSVVLISMKQSIAFRNLFTAFMSWLTEMVFFLSGVKFGTICPMNKLIVIVYVVKEKALLKLDFG